MSKGASAGVWLPRFPRMATVKVSENDHIDDPDQYTIYKTNAGHNCAYFLDSDVSAWCNEKPEYETSYKCTDNQVVVRL